MDIDLQGCAGEGWKREATRGRAAKSALTHPHPLRPKTMTTAVFPVLPVTSAAVSSVPNVLATHTSCLSPLFCREHSAFVFQTSKNPPPFGKPAAEQRIGIRASQRTRDACEVGAHMRSESGGEGTGGPTLRAPLPK